MMGRGPSLCFYLVVVVVVVVAVVVVSKLATIIFLAQKNFFAGYTPFQFSGYIPHGLAYTLIAPIPNIPSPKPHGEAFKGHDLPARLYRKGSSHPSLSGKPNGFADHCPY